jgi:predicted ATPase
MGRHVMTGTPGAGKTSIVNRLRALGFKTVPESATDVIARRQAEGDDEPWERASFVDEIVALQRRRQETADRLSSGGQGGGKVQVYDRSPVCTHALSVYLGRPISAALNAELERVITEKIYEPRVFFVRNLGFCEPSAARRITYEDSLAFEKVHEESYRAFGFELVEVAAGPLEQRVATVVAAVRAESAGDEDGHRGTGHVR